MRRLLGQLMSPSWCKSGGDGRSVSAGKVRPSAGACVRASMSSVLGHFSMHTRLQVRSVSSRWSRSVPTTAVGAVSAGEERSPAGVCLAVFTRAQVGRLPGKALLWGPTSLLSHIVSCRYSWFLCLQIHLPGKIYLSPPFPDMRKSHAV